MPIKVVVNWTVDTAFDLWQLSRPHEIVVANGLMGMCSAG